MSLETVLADAREDAARLAHYGAREQADALTALLDSIRAELREVLTWHDEPGAVLLSGKPAGWFRSRFPEWERRGLRQHRGRGRRYYREVVIPKQPDVISAAEAGRRAAEAAA